MGERSYFLLLYGCALSGKRSADRSKILEAARQLNFARPLEQAVRLLGNFDESRGYLGIPLATSEEKLAKRLDLPVIPNYFSIVVEELASWLTEIIAPDRLRQAETQWLQLRAACRNPLLPESASAAPSGRILLVRDVDEPRGRGPGGVYRLPKIETSAVVSSSCNLRTLVRI